MNCPPQPEKDDKQVGPPWASHQAMWLTKRSTFLLCAVQTDVMFKAIAFMRTNMRASAHAITCTQKGGQGIACFNTGIRQQIANLGVDASRVQT